MIDPSVVIETGEEKLMHKLVTRFEDVWVYLDRIE